MGWGFFSWFDRLRREERDADLKRELQSHLEAEAEERREAGATAPEAAWAARRAFGNLALAEEATREAWGWAALDRLAQDVRFAARSLRHNPGYTLIAVVVLALGIGANTAIFSAVDAALLRPLPFDQPERLVELYQTPPHHPDARSSVGRANFLEWSEQQRVFESLALFHFHGLNLTAGDHPDFLPGAEVSLQFFRVFGVQPLLGRGFAPEEGQPGRDREVVLSYAAWEKHFGGDPGVVGREFSFDRQNYTIIGVMPKGFRYPGWATIWVPVAWSPADRGNHTGGNSLAVARLKPGVTLERAQAEMNAISRNIAAAFPNEYAGWGALAVPLQSEMTSELREPLWILLGAVGLVLLIACSNVASLVLARTSSRAKEIALRAALGARRARVLQMVVVETVLLGAGGGALGLLLAWYGIRFVAFYLGNRLPSMIELQLSGPVLGFALMLSLGCGIAAGLLPALGLTRRVRDLHGALKEGVSRTAASGSRARILPALVTAEAALCMVLLVGAGLLVRTLWVLRSTDPGFDAANVITMELPRSGSGGGGAAGEDAEFLQRVMERLRRLPGVEAAAATTNIPLSGSDEEAWGVQPEGEAREPAASLPTLPTSTVTPGYFTTLHIPLLRGRDFRDSDRTGAARVIIISEAMAGRLWPNQDPIGKRLFTSVFEPDAPREVIGVVGNTRDWGLERPRPLPEMYIPAAQAPRAPDSLLLRTPLPPSEMIPAAEKAIHEVDRQQPVVRALTLEAVISESYADRRSSMLLLGAFAALALALAAAGIYGVLSYSIRRRLREIGIRRALGARRRDVLGLVLLQGMRPTLLGLGLGVAGALAVNRVLRNMVFGVRATDINTYAAVALLLAAVGLAACLVPACRAARVQPMNVLREE